MHKHRGFTLLELSIVIVVIALIIGSIMAGQTLIRGSQIRSVMSETASHIQAINNFRDKYQALPGDFAGAEAIWGSEAACPSTTYTASAHKTTCNGNGDGAIGSLTDTAIQYEMYRAWQHLANAGFIDGAFNGIAGTGGTAHSQLGINVPKSKLSGAGYTLSYVSVTSTADGTNWQLAPSHVLFFGAAATNSYTISPILMPIEALEIDTKTDDTRPAFGTVRSQKTTNCVTNIVTDTSSTYNASYTTAPVCNLLFVTNF